MTNGGKMILSLNGPPGTISLPQIVFTISHNGVVNSPQSKVWIILCRWKYKVTWKSSRLWHLNNQLSAKYQGGASSATASFTTWMIQMWRLSYKWICFFYYFKNRRQWQHIMNSALELFCILVYFTKQQNGNIRSTKHQNYNRFYQF